MSRILRDSAHRCTLGTVAPLSIARNHRATFAALARPTKRTPSATLVIEWHCMRPQPTPAQRELIEFLHETVRSEDIAIVESVQRCMRSRSFNRGPLMVHAEDSSMSEHAVCAFQAKVRHVMNSRAVEAVRHA